MMLQPANRLTLIEAMRPPAGFRFESAVAVTYTLSLQALLATPAAFALSQPRKDPDSGSHESVELLHALRSHASKLTVFCQSGEISLPPSRQVFAFLEHAVVPVTAPRGGVVHPKVWVLRYEAADEPSGGRPPDRRLRVLVASRNLTFDESWDTVVRLEESPEGDGARLAPVGDLFDGLLNAAVGRVSADNRERVQSLSEALRSAAFALPEGVADLHIHILGLTEAHSPLPRDSERSLIISPFVNDDFFTRVHDQPIERLVSRPEGLDRLKPDSLSNVTSVQAFDDGSASEPASQNDRLSPFDPGRPLRGLHAKIFAFEDRNRARLFVGSANATGAAFGSNVEILVELVGPTSVLGIDRLSEGTEEEPGLCDLFYDYSPIENGEPPTESRLDRLRRSIARLAFEGTVEESDDGWSVTYRSIQPLPVDEGVEIQCRPLATDGHQRRVTGGKPMHERFETSLEAISGFLVFELVPAKRSQGRFRAVRRPFTSINPREAAEKADHEVGVVTRFVVPVALDGMPSHRDQSLLRVLVGNSERFFRYLVAMLDEDSDDTGLGSIVERASESDAADRSNGANSPVLEKLLRTMRREPEKLAGLDPLVSDLADDDALPPDFAELWRMIQETAKMETTAKASSR